MPIIIMIRGGGDLSSGVAYRLIHSGWNVIITELHQPMTVRRQVAFSQAIYTEEITVEGIKAIRAESEEDAFELMSRGIIPVLVDPQAKSRSKLKPKVIIDGRMTKLPPDLGMDAAPLVVGLGPGFIAGDNCHAVIETKRGPFLGRVYWSGSAEADTGQPDPVADHQSDRVLRSPADGVFESQAAIGDVLESNQEIARIGDDVIRAPFRGILRGLIHPGLVVTKGVKVGDIDPRLDYQLVDHISDKALAIGGSVLECILSCVELRPSLWE